LRLASRSNAEAAKDAKKDSIFSAAFAAFAFQRGVSYSDTLVEESVITRSGFRQGGCRAISAETAPSRSGVDSIL
jgi:hypothetical protein